MSSGLGSGGTMTGTPGRTDAAPAVSLEEKVRFLERPGNYPHDPHGTSRVDVVETHFALVFLTDAFAYKMKKPARFSSMDFSTLEGRRRDCLDELRLNRRLALDVYLGVIPLTRGGGHRLALDGAGEAVEWLVWMRRLPADRMLDRVISRGRPDNEVLRPVAELLAAFYHDVPSLPPESRRRDHVRRDVEAASDALCTPRFGLPVPRVRRLAADHFHFLDRRGFLLDRRADEGRIVEGHGDLRPEHVHLGPPPAIIDCLEFDRDLRLLDPADDLAFLWLECERLGSAATGEFFLKVYSRWTGDHPAAELLRYYRSLRALIRAGIAIGHLRDGGEIDARHWRAKAMTYLELSRRHLPLP